MRRSWIESKTLFLIEMINQTMQFINNTKITTAGKIIHPEIAKQVPTTEQYNKEPLKIGFTQFHFIKLQIWIFE
jgi:hypothetical protein